MTDHIHNLIKSTKKQYTDDYSYMLRDYNQENETVKGYNGRQLLELLQNCDDEGSTEVLIKLDTKKQQVSIHNIGTPFSKKGYRSLFISNLSSKTEQRKYIGNKGLGFRSIINWSHAIEIQSNNISLSYSKKNQKINFNSLFDIDTQKKILSEENLKDHIIPLPFLTLPEVKATAQNGYVTSIIINYDLNFLEDIVKQIRAITPETILFLNSIEKINFEGLKGKTNISCKRKLADSQPNTFGAKTTIDFESGTSWQIFEKERILPEQFSDSERKSDEFYQIKIAVEKNFEYSSPYLYSFFPTRIKLNQPYILHATFDLDATRNQINDSEKNRYILKKVVKFTKKVATYFSRNEVSYKPLEILHHSHKSDTLSELGYYELIAETINSEAILPCVDNSYKTVADSIYINNDFGQMLLDIEATEEISCHLIPLEDKELSDYDLLNPIDDSLVVLQNVVDIINKISLKPFTIDQRANFIYQIVQNCTFIKDDFENRMSFLINDGFENIQEGEYIYTPITKENELRTPSYANIQFINRDLFENLLERFHFYDEDNPNKGRFLYDELKGFCNIHSYEPATLAQKIISEARNRIKENPQLSHETVKEMNKCLFHNFLQLMDGTQLPDAVKVPAINKNGKIKLVDKLVFSNDYATGRITEIIFKNIYDNNDYIASPNDSGLDDGDEYQVEEYLKWIGLNEFARYEKVTHDEEDLSDYRYYVNGKVYEEIDARIRANLWTVKKIKSIIERISVEKLILWIHFDEKLRLQLDDSDNKDSLDYYRRKWHEVYVKPSFIKYQIEIFGIHDYSDYLIDERFSWVNNFSLNFSEPYFKVHEISKSRINALLILLDAKEEFSDLSIEKVTEILNKLPEKFSTGKKTQSIYKRALTHYKENELRLNDEVILFADDGEGLKPFSQDKIYFSDNIKLPIHLMKDFPVFNFPARAGGVEAIEFFGINDLSNINIEISSYHKMYELDQQFSEFLELLKPIILTFRINVIEENKIQKVQASICNKIRIVLCSDIKYEIDESYYEVQDYEYIHHDEQTYYVKINETDTLSKLKSNRVFTNSCANIISLSFDVRGDRNEFRHLFIGDYNDVLKNIKTDFGQDTYNEARELLGLADYKQAFWQAVFNSKEHIYQNHLDDLALEDYILKVLKIEVDISFLDYENINGKNEVMKVQELFDRINIDLESFAKHYSYDVSLENLHFDSIKNHLLSMKTTVKSVVWNKYNTLDIEEQSEYLHQINRFENYFDFARELSEMHKHNFNIDLDLIFKEYFSLLYGGILIGDKIDIDEKRAGNAESFSKDELYEISQSEHLKSLMYFQNALDFIKKEISEPSIILDAENPEGNSNTQFDDSILISSDKLKDKNKDFVNKKPKSGVYTPKESEERKLKEKGDTSEEIVFDHFKKNNFKNVDWVSRDNEGLHCDIRYTDENGIIKYVEVKTFDAGKFHLTRSEYEFGKKEISNYEIWLVRDKKKIIQITDFFTNNKYNPITSEYEVFLDLI